MQECTLSRHYLEPQVAPFTSEDGSWGTPDERAYAQGMRELDELLASLNDSTPGAPGRKRWTADAFIEQVEELARSIA